LLDQILKSRSKEIISWISVSGKPELSRRIVSIVDEELNVATSGIHVAEVVLNKRDRVKRFAER
jgi:hypothetical protein